MPTAEIVKHQLSQSLTLVKETSPFGKVVSSIVDSLAIEDMVLRLESRIVGAPLPMYCTSRNRNNVHVSPHHTHHVYTASFAELTSQVLGCVVFQPLAVPSGNLHLVRIVSNIVCSAAA